MSGLLWATASGLGFGLFQSLNRRAVRDIEDPYASTFIQLAIATVVLVAVTLASGDQAALADAGAWPIIAFALGGVVHFLCGWTLLNISQQRVGATRTSPLLTTQPVFGMVMALIVYQQMPSAVALVAMTPIVVGAYAVSARSSGLDIRPVDALPGLAAAFMWSLSPILIVSGLKSVNAPLAAVTVGMVAATAGYGAVLLWNRSGLRAATADREALTFKVVAAVLVALATWWRWRALDDTSVAAVLALSLLSVPVVLFVAPRLVGRHLEAVTPRVWAGSGAVVAGSLALIAVG